MLCTITNPRLKSFPVSVCVLEIKILDKIKFNQEILTKLLREMHQLRIDLPYNSDYQTADSFCEIKHFLVR